MVFSAEPRRDPGPRILEGGDDDGPLTHAGIGRRVLRLGSGRVELDRVQEIVFEQTPFVYLVHPNVLLGVSPSVRNAQASALPPHLYWNIEYLAK